jgi:hypothetical protein
VKNSSNPSPTFHLQTWPEAYDAHRQESKLRLEEI